MPVSRTSYTLTAEQLDAALVALAKASETFRISPFERGLSRVLTIWIAVFVQSMAAIPFTFLLLGKLGCCLAIVAIAAGFVALVLLLANSGLVLKTLRQRRLVKQLGLREISYSAWKADRKRHPSISIGWTLLTVMAVAVLIGTVFIGWPASSASEIVTFLLFLAVAATPLAWLLIQRSRQQLDVLDDASNLRELLKLMQADAGDTVVVPAAVLEKVAGIEQAQIARERARAVVAGVSDSNRGYGVLIAKDVAEQKASLPADRRLDVEALIAELMVQPSPSGDEQSARTADGSVEIHYSVDEQNRRIRVVALRTQEPNVV
jgi:hypothetical protein